MTGPKQSDVPRWVNRRPESAFAFSTIARSVFCFLIAVVARPSHAHPQGVAGRVVELVSLQPVAAASVQLYRGNTLLQAALTDSSGRFSIQRNVLAGDRILVDRIGYAQYSDTFVEPPREELLLRVRVDPVKFDSIDVAAVKTPGTNRWLESNGFYARRRMGLGRFLTHDDFIKDFVTARRAADILRRVPGVTRVQEAPNEDIIYLRNSQTLRTRGGPCRARIFIDGIPGESIPVAHPDNYEAIEVYRGPSEVPPRFGGAESACGVIVIWTSLGSVKR